MMTLFLLLRPLPPQIPHHLLPLYQPLPWNPIPQIPLLLPILPPLPPHCLHHLLPPAIQFVSVGNLLEAAVMNVINVPGKCMLSVARELLQRDMGKKGVALYVPALVSTVRKKVE